MLYGQRSPADAPMELDWGFLSLFPDRATQAEYQKLIKDVETWSVQGPPRSMVLVARVPGPRSGRMPIRVEGVPGWTPARVERVLSGLPMATGYEVVIKPLRYRTRPHVAAYCEFNEKRITVQVPMPFKPFTEPVPYRARRLRKKRRMSFRWYTRTLRFDRPDELIRYLYLHEYYHWYLREVRGKRSAAETACDRFALQQLGRGR